MLTDGSEHVVDTSSVSLWTENRTISLKTPGNSFKERSELEKEKFGHSPDSSQRCRSGTDAPQPPETPTQSVIQHSSPQAQQICTLYLVQMLSDVTFSTTDVQSKRKRPKEE